MDELPLPAGLTWTKEPFRRGFPSAILARDGAAFTNRAEVLFARYPIESVECRGDPRGEVREASALASGWPASGGSASPPGSAARLPADSSIRRISPA